MAKRFDEDGGRSWLPVSEDGNLARAQPGTPSTLEPPRIDGYRLIEMIGQGGMGTVWRAEQLSTGREVAVKFLIGAPFGSERIRARFVREVELTARLNHPHIAHVYDSGLERGAHYFVMQLVRGVPLDQYVSKEKLSQNEIVRLIATVCQAVDYAHQRGIIHRDLKPSNILVDHEGQPHIMDFGLASSEDDAPVGLHLTQGILGTIAYMSPEQANGEHDRVTTRSDVYALGVILYKLVTGQMPHDDSQMRAALLRSIGEGRITPPRQVQPQIDRGVEAILLKATSHQPQDRYATAGILAEDIQNLLNDVPLQARPLTLMVMVGHGVRRYRRRAAIALVICVVFGIGGWALTRHTNSLQEQSVSATSRAIRTEYHNFIVAARRALDHHDVAGAQAALERCEPSLRDIEWKYLWTQCDQSQKTFEIHGPGILSLGFDKSGEHLIALNPRKALHKWNVRTGEAIHQGTVELPARRGSVTLGVSQQETQGQDNRLPSIYEFEADASTRAILRRGENARTLAISADYQRVALLGRDGRLEVYDSQNSTPLWQRDVDPSIYLMCLSADGTQLVIIGEGIEVIRIDDGKTVLAIDPELPVSSATFIADSKRLVLGSRDGHISLVDCSSGRVTRPWQAHDGAISAMCATTTDGEEKLVTAGADRTVRVWDIQNWKLLDLYHGHSTSISALAVVSTGDLIASGGIDGQIKLWPMPRDQGEAVFQATEGAMTSFAISDDGRWLACAQYNKIHLLDFQATPPAERVFEGHVGMVTTMTFSPTADVLITADENSSVYVWSVAAGEMIRSLEGLAGAAYGLAISPDGTQLAAVTSWRDRHLVVWEIATGRVLADRQGFAPIAWHPTRSTVATAMLDRATDRFGYQLWNTQTWQPVETRVGHDSDVTHITFEPIRGHEVAVADRSGNVRVTDAQTGGLLAAFQPHPGEAIFGGVRYSASGQRLITTGSTVDIWDAAQGTRLLKIAPEADGPYLLGAQGLITNRIFTATPLQISQWLLKRPEPHRRQNLIVD